MALPNVDDKALVSFLADLLNTPSPTGLAEPAIAFTEKAFTAINGVKTHRTYKGALVASWDGEKNDAPRALTAHADTLGAMVKEIKESGRLSLTQIGGYAWNSIETEGCYVITRKGDIIRGSILLTKASSHVFGSEVGKTERSGDNREVRLDAVVKSADDVRKLGIEVGDFVAAGMNPKQPVHILISNYEEVGHGAAAGIPADVHELVAVDMAAVGTGQNSDEFHTTLCVKDSGGPYHNGLSNHLRDLAEANGIDYKVDIYPYYGSDGEALWRAGGNAAVALIGPGIDASHSYERTHVDALIATTRWIMAYLLS